MLTQRADNTVMRHLALIVAAAASFLLAGCAASTLHTADARQSVAISDPTVLTLLHRDGTPASWHELITACVSADAVLIGECHGMEVGQAFQARLFRDLIAQAPAASGALEFIERDNQAAVDDYLSGISTEEEFRRAARLTDSNYTSGHRAIVEACKAAGRPVSAANASRRYVRLARSEGFDRLRELTPEQQRLVVLPEFLPDGRYRDDFFKVMGGKDLLEADPTTDAAKAEANAKRSATIDAMFRSQSVWDWTMADSVARQLDQGGQPVVLIVGRFHTDHDGGLVSALRHMRPAAGIVTISSVDRWSQTLSEEERNIADFIVFIGE